MCPAVKRWERLVHLELAEISDQVELKGVRRRCGCGRMHREIFAIPHVNPTGQGIGLDRGGGKGMDRVDEIGLDLGGKGRKGAEEAYIRVKEVLVRWEGFVSKICED